MRGEGLGGDVLDVRETDNVSDVRGDKTLFASAEIDQLSDSQQHNPSSGCEHIQYVHCDQSQPVESILKGCVTDCSNERKATFCKQHFKYDHLMASGKHTISMLNTTVYST